MSYMDPLAAFFGAVSSELSAKPEADYTPHEIKEIELVARVMDLGNRGANTWDAMLSRLRGNPSSDSHLLDELVLSGVFWTVAPVTILALSRATNRPYLEMAMSMFDYVSHYEDRDISVGA